MEYKQHHAFVDSSTNQPRKLNQLDSSIFPYPVVEKPEPFTCFTKDQLLSADECEYLVWLAETLPFWPGGSMKFWEERNVGLLTGIPRHGYASIFTARLVLGIHQKIKEFVSKSFGVEAYADQIGIVRWPPGSFQMVHIDAVPERTRICGSVVYLNDDYRGGRTYYPYYGKEHTPKAGTIFAHDAGHSHLHGVTQILDKTRYTISSTWSTDPKDSVYEDNLRSLKGYLEQFGQPEQSHGRTC